MGLDGSLCGLRDGCADGSLQSIERATQVADCAKDRLCSATTEIARLVGPYRTRSVETKPATAAVRSGVL